MKMCGTEVRLVELNQRDIPGLIALSDSVGWDYDEPELVTILSSGRGFGHKTEQGSLVSSSAVLPYGEELASIGMVIVHPAYQGRGLGTAAVEACMGTVGEQAAVMLIATKEGEPLYKKLGFDAVTCVHKMVAERYSAELPVHEAGQYEIEPFDGMCLDQVHRLDRCAVGAERHAFLHSRIRQAKQCVVLRDTAKQIAGYGLAVAGPVHLVLGPIIAPNPEAAACLIHHLAAGHDGKLRIDVPDEQRALLPYLRRCGFERATQPPVMFLHGRQMPARNGTLYGIAAQIFG
ncbi:GNAT family N-acetyltransferase [Paenibacillus thiaminolyticus]|uniref:GNAT family N-acetyltransferase n=1 Tax=Paenibacillus thiaminolyticus TaxID=49283 RepID=UPI001165282A|nr:GNAT family N-acetyltransferase [Paenibacillus thiaminolyticus]NGP61231.1 GNAT family N-acetyltransferase [Paenibacillus thiaminolyticus]WCR25210.1 GNAT family N-acetyltransferase [Paenibacillus thiaminolyticus]